MQNPKNPRKSKVCMRQSNIFLQLSKGFLIAFGAVAKGNQIPFGADCMRNLRIACNTDNVSNIPLRELNLKMKKYRQVLKLCLPSAVFIPMRAYRTIALSGRSNLVRRYLLTQFQLPLRKLHGFFVLCGKVGHVFNFLLWVTYEYIPLLGLKMCQFKFQTPPNFLTENGSRVALYNTSVDQYILAVPQLAHSTFVFTSLHPCTRALPRIIPCWLNNISYIILKQSENTKPYRGLFDDFCCSSPCVDNCVNFR